MLFQHEIKKIRNSILKSKPGGKRNLVHKSRQISWKHWEDAYEWDLITNTIRVHHKLTDDHLHPDQRAKMKNHLAEETMNADMLHLMEVSIQVGTLKNSMQNGLKC